LGREVYIDRDDFMLDPPKKFFRLGAGREVRLRYGYVVKCEEVITNDAGEPVELRCSHDPATGGGQAPEGRRVKGVVHWVNAEDAVAAEVRLYDHLFNRPDPGADGDFLADLNPDSLQVLSGCLFEPALADAPRGQVVQFERVGYFTPAQESTPEQPVFLRTIGLRDTWAKIQAKG